MKVNKSILIGLALVLLMVSPTFINFLSSIIFQPSLPKENVVNYELDVQQKNLALRQGKVLMEFFYGSSCSDCRDKISFLEYFANQYKDKTFLEKILVNESTQKLNIIGFNITENKIYLDERYLEGKNITEENVKEILCEVTIVPPVDCVKI
jgi:thiol-disulfide isomerase/thioredoxin